MSPSQPDTMSSRSPGHTKRDAGRIPIHVKMDSCKNGMDCQDWHGKMDSCKNGITKRKMLAELSGKPPFSGYPLTTTIQGSKAMNWIFQIAKYLD